MYYTAQLI